MNTQTVFQAGNSKVVSLPTSILSDLKIRTGDKVVVEKADDTSIIIRKVSPKPKTSRSQKDFNRWLNTFMDENGEILDELAKR